MIIIVSEQEAGRKPKAARDHCAALHPTIIRVFLLAMVQEMFLSCLIGFLSGFLFRFLSGVVFGLLCTVVLLTILLLAILVTPPAVKSLHHDAL
jgi:hypothetical protein